MISTGATGAAISVSGVTKRFDDITAVDNVSLTIHPGEVIALLGHNGAGKTTLLDMILGFTTPDSGSITVLGGVFLPRLLTLAVLEQCCKVAGY